VEQIARVFIEILRGDIDFFKSVNNGMNVIDATTNRVKMAVIGSIYCPIILALVHETPQLTMAIMRRIMKRESFRLFTKIIYLLSQFFGNILCKIKL